MTAKQDQKYRDQVDALTAELANLIAGLKKDGTPWPQDDS